MSKRPPSRPAHRNAVDAPVFPAGLGPAADAVGVDAQSGLEPRLGPTASRQDFSELLDALKAQGHLSAADEAAVLREYDAMLSQLRAEKTRLEAEYRARISTDGQAPADEWLAGEAAALGRRQGEQLRQLVKTIPALAPTEAAG